MVAFGLVFFFALSVVSGLEEAQPEIFLPPRNFNPHPYEINAFQYNRIDVAAPNTGPVLFPSNREPSAIQTQDPHPYAGVVKKKKYSLGLGRFQKEDLVNPQVYQALAIQGAKVLSVPRAKDLKEVQFDPSYENQKKQYSFSYKVASGRGDGGGDDFSHRQSQNSHATNGEYRVKLPDGRLQIVSYTADRNGYKADVKYAENERRFYGDVAESGSASGLAGSGPAPAYFLSDQPTKVASDYAAKPDASTSYYFHHSTAADAAFEAVDGNPIYGIAQY